MSNAVISDVVKDLERISADPEALSLHDSSRFYRYEIGQVSLLSADRVKQLAEQIENARAKMGVTKKRGLPRLPREPRDWRNEKELEAAREETDAKRELIEANLRLVMHIARKYRGFGVDLMDLVQEEKRLQARENGTSIFRQMDSILPLINSSPTTIMTKKTHLRRHIHR